MFVIVLCCFFEHKEILFAFLLNFIEILTGCHSELLCQIVLVVIVRVNGDLKFLTKGDNNQVDDRGLYAPGQLWLEKKDVVGRAKGSDKQNVILFTFRQYFDNF